MPKVKPMKARAVKLPDCFWEAIEVARAVPDEPYAPSVNAWITKAVRIRLAATKLPPAIRTKLDSDAVLAETLRRPRLSAVK